MFLRPADPVGLVWRPITRNDLDEVSALLTAIELVDQPTERHSVAELGQTYEETDADTAHNSLVGRDAAGTVVAYGWNHPISSDISPRRVFLAGGVHPDHRGRGIGRALLEWQLERGRHWYRATLQDDFGSLQLTAYVDETLSAQRRLYERAGLSPLRWYADMTLELGAALPDVQVPAGVRIVPFNRKYSEAVRQAHNEAFAELWGAQPVDAVRWEQQLAHSSARPQWSWVALDGRTSEVVGYAINSSYEQDSAARGVSEGWTDRIGVRPGWRGRGIANALLCASMRSFADAGLAAAGLGVDSDSPSGALRLYRRLGYEATETLVMYARTEDIAADG